MLGTAAVEERGSPALFPSLSAEGLMEEGSSQLDLGWAEDKADSRRSSTESCRTPGRHQGVGRDPVLETC